MRTDFGCRRRICCIALALTVLEFGTLCAQAETSELLFGYLPASRVRAASHLDFPADPLSFDAPDWELAGCHIYLGDREQATSRLLERLAQKLDRLTEIYDLTPRQQQKLMAAAEVDMARFWRTFDHVSDAEPARPNHVNLYRRLWINCDFFYAQSLFNRVLETILTAEQHQYRQQFIATQTRAWLKQADAAEILGWLSKQAHLSLGQRARLQSMLTQTKVVENGSTSIDRFLAIDKSQWQALLNDSQLQAVVSTLDVCCDASR